MAHNDEHLTQSFEAVLEKLQASAHLRPDQDRRAYYTIAVMQTFLEHFSETTRLTKAQREHLLRIVQTWDTAIFGTMEPPQHKEV